jgi:hypothetical protein
VDFDDHLSIIGMDEMDKWDLSQLVVGIAQNFQCLGVRELDRFILGDENGFVGIFDQFPVFFF